MAETNRRWSDEMEDENPFKLLRESSESIVITAEEEVVKDDYTILDLSINENVVGHVIINVKHKDVAAELQRLMASNSFGLYTQKKPKLKPSRQVSDLFFKTEACRSEYNGTGSCSYGNRCRFAHSDGEIREHQDRCSKVMQYI